MATTNGGPLRAPDTTVVFTPSTITVAVGETATINYSSGTAAPSASTLDTLFGGIATTEVDGGGMVGTIVISGVSAGTASIAPSTPLGNGATMSQGGFTLTVTAPVPVEDDKFLNKRGLTHFWENIDEIKQDKLTAGANITIAADNTISASQPTVGNATLTIQKNGTTVKTFTANASSNVTANITVPTQTSELTNNSGFLTSSTAVTSFNGSTGAITYTAPVTSVNGSTGAIAGLQTTSNLVTSVSGSSTDSQYPSAKLFYDTIGNVETILNTLNNGGGAQ